MQIAMANVVVHDTVLYDKIYYFLFQNVIQ